jgi:hypothetical protein
MFGKIIMARLTEEEKEDLLTTPYLNKKIMKSRRENVNNIFQRNQKCVSIYDYLSKRSNARKWRYICCIDGAARRIMGIACVPPRPIENHDVETDEGMMLDNSGIKPAHFNYPWLFLQTTSSLIMARFVLTDRLIHIYDIHKNKVLLEPILIK